MYYLISSISEKIRFKYVANVEFYYLISRGFCSLVLVKISVSILLDGGCNNVLIKHILAVEVNARAVNEANNEQGGGMYGSLVITGKYKNQNSTQVQPPFPYVLPDVPCVSPADVRNADTSICMAGV